MAILGGWGRGTWSSGAWSTPLPVEVSGLEATSSVGSAAVAAGAGVFVVGVQSQGRVNNAIVWSALDPDVSSDWTTIAA